MTPDGVRARLGVTDRLMLKRVSEVLQSVGVESDDPAIGRLRPSLYGPSEGADANIEAMMRDELETGRAADLSIVDEALQGSGNLVLTDEEADAWVRVLGDARLVVAARLGIEDDSWERDASGGFQKVFLQYLSYAQASLTDALLEQLED